ncbi:MAG: phospholipase [Bacteroidota bacterium]
MKIHHIEVKKTARYATWGEPNPQTKQLWFACHGYGQLAPYFIKKFDMLDPQENFVVAPEALSRFYQGGFTGRVGATWMTKEDRENEIKDYLAYLQSLYTSIIREIPVDIDQLKINLLGFSQGTATISRWAFTGQIPFQRLIIWAGGIAHDVDYARAPEILENRVVYFVYGTQDELIQQDQFQKQLEQIENNKIPAQVITFEGKHELNREIIQNLAKS